MLNIQDVYYVLDYTVDQFLKTTSPGEMMGPLFLPMAAIYLNPRFKDIYGLDVKRANNTNRYSLLKNQQKLRDTLNEILIGN